MRRGETNGQQKRSITIPLCKKFNRLVRDKICFMEFLGVRPRAGTYAIYANSVPRQVRPARHTEWMDSHLMKAGIVLRKRGTVHNLETVMAVSWKLMPTPADMSCLVSRPL